MWSFLSQAAPSLKAVVTALYLLSIAVGDIIIIIIAQLKLFDSLVSFPSYQTIMELRKNKESNFFQATEMFVFAGAMFVTIGFFILLAMFYYEYANNEDEEEENEESDEKE